jgi:rhamnose utilization protein RhaD (predicted bifunctional aldolase and dehydrogenase)
MTRGAASPPPATAELLEAAARVTRRFGEDPEYSRAGGGNSSVKVGGTLYIKPSGVSLASITAASLMPLAIGPLLELAAHGSEEAAVPGRDPVMRVAMAARLRDEGDQRPSVECVFHALIPRRFVVHTHPTTVNALTCATDGEAIARDLFGDSVVWVPYTDPGLPLAREIDHRRRSGPEVGRAGTTEVTLLQNHGLIVAGDDPAAVIERSERVVGMIRELLARRSAPPGFGAVVSAPQPDPALVQRLSHVLAMRLGDAAAPAAVVFDGSPEALRLAGTAEGRAIVDAGPLTPDQAVYAGSWPLWLDVDPVADWAALDRAISAGLTAHAATRRPRPVVVVVAGVGLFASGPTPRRAETARELYVDAIRVGFGALALGGFRALAPAERAFIETWEAEVYRLSIDAG